MYKFEDLRGFSFSLRDLIKIQKRINKLDCERCNGTIQDDKYDSNIAKCLMKAQAILGRYELTAFHQSDPRGCSLYAIPSDWKGDIEYTNGIACI